MFEFSKKKNSKNSELLVKSADISAGGFWQLAELT